MGSNGAMNVQEVCQCLEAMAPLCLAETWDNVGLLVGQHTQTVARIMTCLTITRDSVDEAVAERADLIVSHHPLPFRPVQRITDETMVGELLGSIMRHGISVYSPHTAFDSARRGINQRLAEMLGLREIAALCPPRSASQEVGSGRMGRLKPALSFRELTDRAKQVLGLAQVRGLGGNDRPVALVGVGCGSGGEYLAAARTQGADVFVTGEASFHTCLEAEASGMGLLLLGHFASERFGIEALAAELQQALPDLTVWASRKERDPIRTW